MKKRYILLLLVFLFALYVLWCNVSFIHTRKPDEIAKLKDKVEYAKDSFATSNATLIWQGFYHDWNYNHRVSRLGDWWQPLTNENNTFKAVFNHTAASGSGSDILNYTTYFTYLKSNMINTFSSVVNVVVQGREATTITKVITVKGVLPESMRRNNNFTVLLNGFDIISRSLGDKDLKGSGNSDKLAHLLLDVNNIKITGNEFQFDVTIQLGADCDSPECVNFTPGDNEWFDYQMAVAYQVIAYNNGVHVTDKKINQSYKWYKPMKSRPDIDPNEIFRDRKALNNNTIHGVGGYNIGIPAIRSIEIDLPKGEGGLLRKRLETPHLLNLDIAITDFSYNSANGICVFDADLFFKNWKPNMPLLSYGNNGSANINLGLKLIQLNDNNAMIETQAVKGTINWETTQLEQRNADDPNSKKSFIYSK